MRKSLQRASPATTSAPPPRPPLATHLSTLRSLHTRRCCGHVRHWQGASRQAPGHTAAAVRRGARAPRGRGTCRTRQSSSSCCLRRAFCTVNAHSRRSTPLARRYTCRSRALATLAPLAHTRTLYRFWTRVLQTDVLHPRDQAMIMDVRFSPCARKLHRMLLSEHAFPATALGSCRTSYAAPASHTARPRLAVFCARLSTVTALRGACGRLGASLCNAIRTTGPEHAL